VTSERDELDRGNATTTVTMRHPGVVILSASYDPGWTATVDGHPTPTQMVAPALVATTVPAGTHRIAFRYRGSGSYVELFVLCGVTLAALLAAHVTRSGRERGDRHCRDAAIPRQSRRASERIKTHGRAEARTDNPPDRSSEALATKPAANSVVCTEPDCIGRGSVRAAPPALMSRHAFIATDLQLNGI
jgi:Bacterial membrane protein YfhO